MRPEYANHVWSWDFVMERTHDGRVLKILVLIDEFTRAASRAARGQANSQ
jgi:hypothetical protein